MEFFNKTQQNQKQVERLTVMLFTVYGLSLCIGILRSEEEVWSLLFMLAAIAAVWIIHISKYRNYRIRAVCITVIMQLTVILYTANKESLIEIVPTFIVMLVLIALCGFADLLFLTILSAFFIVFYHWAIAKTFMMMTPEELGSLLPQIGNVLCVELLLYIWIRNRNVRNEQVYEIIEALMDAEQSKDDFLSNVSHEIRTPVNTICGMSEMALREHDPEKMRDEIFDIRDAGHNLMSLVSDILDFSQLQQGKMNIEEEAYNITSTVNDIINMAMARKGDKQVELIVDCDANIPSTLMGDEKKIRRVIMNLLDNAIKFTNDGGIIIRIYARKEDYGVNLCVSIKDTGIGIGDEALEKLFESFSQVDTRRNRQEGGVGLGLAISKQLLQKMGGTITVRSRLGKGSLFRFVVPQKVLEEKPIVQVENRENLNIAAYFDMEQFDMMTIRDEYSKLIMDMVKQLRVKCHVCRNLSELKRREEIDAFTHIFISLEEYREDEEYFDNLSKKTNIIIVIERYNEKYILNPDIIRLYKPFYILPVVSILNGSRDSMGGKQMIRPGKFTAPDAHVLVVDDNRMNVRVVEGLLKEYQIRVTYASGGREALELIENMSYDFVFMDHMMPEMDGVETMHRIRDKVGRYYQKVPIIALTANAAPGNREMFLEEGFDDFVEKPLEISVLERVLKRNLPDEKIVYHEEAERDTEAESSNEAGKGRKSADNNKTGDALKGGSGEKSKAAEDELIIGDLDVEKGILYCGSRNAYLGVLEECYTQGAEEHRLLNILYDNREWENYIIKVHALKSTMKGIGADKLSKMAKTMENAGKNNDINYILENHNALLTEHCRVMNELADSELFDIAETTDKSGNEADVPDERSKSGKLDENDKFDENDKPEEMDDETFDKFLQELEDAAYSLNGEQMSDILIKMQRYQYRGQALKDKLELVKKKVEKSDYMSALDNVAQIKEGDSLR